MTMASEPNGWMPQAQWDALVRGEQCPLCRAYHAGAWIDAYGSTIADLVLLHPSGQYNRQPQIM